ENRRLDDSGLARIAFRIAHVEIRLLQAAHLHYPDERRVAPLLPATDETPGAITKDVTKCQMHSRFRQMALGLVLFEGRLYLDASLSPDIRNQIRVSVRCVPGKASIGMLDQPGRQEVPQHCR